MTYKLYFLSLFLFFYSFGYSQNNIQEKEFLALTAIETPSFTIHFEYNATGQVISETKEAFENDYLSYKYEYEYDENENILVLYSQNVNGRYMEENDYNENNQVVEKRIYEDYGLGFKFMVKQLYAYQEDLLASILFYVGQNLRQDKKQEFVYNEYEQLIQVKQYAWISEQWVSDEIFDFEYDDWGATLFYAHEVNGGDGFWKQWRYHFVYNDDNEIAERTYHIGAGTDWNASPSEKYLFFYDDLKEDETLLLPNVYQFDKLDVSWFQSGKKIVKDSLWIADCSFELHFVETATYSYEPITINSDEDEEVYVIETQSIASLQVYPNPTAGELTITNYELQITDADIQIFDITGHNVHSFTCPPMHSFIVNISHLHSGIYFVKIKTEKEIITKRIIKM